MRISIVLVTLVAAAAVAPLMTPLPVSGQVPEFDPTNPRASFQVMAEYLARDGGKWRAANPNHDGSADSPPEFGLWFESHLGGRVLELQIVVLHRDRSVISSRGQWMWHPGSGELRYLVTARGGGVTEGVTTFPNAITFRTDATRFGMNGSIVEHRDDNVLVSDSVHRNETFEIVNGQAVSGGVYEWRRDSR